MKNWSQNLLFILFSFLFMGLGMLLADFYIQRNGNPFKQQTSYVASPADALGANNNAYPSVSNTSNTLEEDTTSLQSAVSESETAPVAAPVEKAKEPIKEVQEEEAGNDGNTYVVTGVFGKEANAKAMISKLKNLGYSHAFGFPRKKLTAVTAGAFSEKEARKIKSRLESKGLDAVVMEK